ncbi:unnamed protein product [Tilletia controversa]|nr:unnamed protein product [Tilletia controversa]
MGTGPTPWLASLSPESRPEANRPRKPLAPKALKTPSAVDGAKTPYLCELGKDIAEPGDAGYDDHQLLAEIIQVKRWRHRVQKAFFGKAPPKDADMPAMAEIFQQVEAHQMSEEALKQSKLGKVMKKIAKTKDDYPQESKFRFKERAEELYKRWIHVH